MAKIETGSVVVDAGPLIQLDAQNRQGRRALAVRAAREEVISNTVIRGQKADIRGQKIRPEADQEQAEEM